MLVVIFDFESGDTEEPWSDTVELVAPEVPEAVVLVLLFFDPDIRLFAVEKPDNPEVDTSLNLEIRLFISAIQIPKS